ncbi:hypothetical protein CSX00_00005, partial [Pseudobutyrivibrio ruminis]
GNIIQPFAFTGYQEDEFSGLKFAQARFYDDKNGRFVGEDQVRGFINHPESINHYLYCLNMPSCRIDLNGKESYYIFYSETQFSWQATSRYYELIGEGVDSDDIVMVGFDKGDTHEDFINAWNNLPDSQIEEIDIYMHSNPTTLIMPNDKYGINVSGVSSIGTEIGKYADLDEKNVDTISFITCNSGLVTTDINIASIVAQTQNVDKVYSWNGSVAFDWGLQMVEIDLGFYTTYEFVLHATPRISHHQGIENDTELGQVCYYVKDGNVYYYYVNNPDEIYLYGEADYCGN